MRRRAREHPAGLAAATARYFRFFADLVLVAFFFQQMGQPGVPRYLCPREQVRQPFFVFGVAISLA
jgi:hypothetical protein